MNGGHRSGPSTGRNAAAHRLRAAMVEQLRSRGVIDDPRIAAAMAAVPRHLALPGVGLEQAYAVDRAIVTQRDADHHATSSLSAPDMQARQLAQLVLREGMAVLEIGSGGPNAAYLAALVGPSGRVTTMDIDPRVCAGARAFLREAGFGQVEVVEGDAEYGWPRSAPYDRIIATVEMPDLPAAWLDQLSPDGRLVAPLRIFGGTRSAALRRRGKVLVGDDLVWCGFVPLQGAGRWGPPSATITLADGSELVLAADQEQDLAAVDPAALAALLDDPAAPRTELWAEATVARGTTLEWLYLRLLSTLPGALTMDAPASGQALSRVQHHPGPPAPAIVEGSSMAHFAVRPGGAGRFELGAVGIGDAGASLARRVIDVVDAWASDRERRPVLRVGPRGEGEPGAGTIRRRHQEFSLGW